MSEQIKAVSLISGGMDSALATALIQDQNINVISLIFITGFDAAETRSFIFNPEVDPQELQLNSRKAADRINSEYRIVDIRNDFWRLVKNPRNGYGSGYNPCMDCRIFMLQKAKEIMKELGASFIITGEVLDQRPFTQTMQSLRRIDKLAGVKGLVLRPLSAKLFDETIAEQKGWVDRNKLLAIHGRRRTVQHKLASRYGLLHITSAGGGGCLCIDPHFGKKADDLFKNANKESLDKDDFEWLKFGRHFRLSPQVKLVIGRDWVESDHIERLSRKTTAKLLSPRDNKESKAALQGKTSERDVQTALSILAGYLRPQREQHPIWLIENGKRELYWIKARPKEDFIDFMI